jgi:LacI family transcriptional regulator
LSKRKHNTHYFINESVSLATIKEVAALAGVSFKTVSRVLNDDANVSSATREKVLHAIEQLDYRPNLAARYMRTGRSQLIGFITDEIATSPFAGDVIRGAQHEAWQQQKLLFVINTDLDPDIEQEAISMMLERRVEGIIYATMYHRPVEPSVSIRDVPTVLLDCFVEDGSLPSVVPDETKGGRVATEALLKQGHRRIGFLNYVKPIPASLGRLEGYKQALAQHGIPYDESLVCTDEGDAGGGYRCALSLLERANRPSALFCFNDWMAMGAYDAIRKLGLQIPDGVAVIGFDNMEIIASQLHPPLTTMQLPHYDMGQWAVRRLIEHVENPVDGQPAQFLMDCPLIERQSI